MARTNQSRNRAAEIPPAPEPHIVYMVADQLQLAPRNPKEHDLTSIMQSLQRFGFVAPCVLNEATQRIVVGHGRVRAVLQLRDQGCEPPTRVRVDEEGRWLVPVLAGVSFATPGEAEAYLVADNRLTELGGWDQAGLFRVLDELAELGPQALEGTGYDPDDLDTMRFLFQGDGAEGPAGAGADPAGQLHGETTPDQLRVIVVFKTADDRTAFLAEHLGKTGKDAEAVTHRWARPVTEEPQEPAA
jgi:hypothetical protein